MPQDDAVYDLGNVDLEDRKPARFPTAFAGTPMPGDLPRERPRAERRASGRAGPELAGSLSLFVPGLGHLAAGQPAWALFYAAGFGCCASLLWAAFATRDRLAPTLRVLEIPVAGALIALACVVVTAVLIHLASIAHAQNEAGASESPSHPIVAALASLLIPGWGQILAGHRRRATFFVASLWLIAAGWLAVTPLGARALRTLGLALPPALHGPTGVAILIAAPAVVWIIAVYDATRR